MNNKKRGSGVLLHVSSLHGEYSVGSFGKEAFEFIDFLSDCGFSYWQVLPFCMTDDCDSPYRSYSSFAANPYFIDLPTLQGKGLISDSQLKEAEQSGKYLCEYERLAKERLALLRSASKMVNESEKALILDFISKNPELYRACEFLALRELNDDLPWQKWTSYTADSDTLFSWQFIQYEFFSQWKKVKEYANSKGISVIGDLPIYVALDSADVYANKEQFLLDEDGHPTSVAGVPPDYFSEDGQLWNNPLYDWKFMKKDGYSWWIRRIEHMFSMFDGIRIDHFRGFESFWSIPASAKTAKEGHWVKGPGRDFIKVLKGIAPEKLIIAEDLGDITEEVNKLLAYSTFPGMRVLQFAFVGDTSSPHLPHNYTDNCVAYTGTHDNNTLLGYVWECDGNTRRKIFDYCGYYGNDFSEGCEYIIRTMLSAHANKVIFPIQDIFVFGADTRMNTPGIANGNWRYRITKEQLSLVDRQKYKHLNSLYSRI